MIVGTTWRSEIRTFYNVSIDQQVATVAFVDRNTIAADAAVEPHLEFADLVTQLSFDDTVRVIVLRGHNDASFLTPVSPPPERAAGPGSLGEHRLWQASTGIVRAHLAVATCDKPVVVRIGGDAINIGSSYVFAADISVADESARIADNHLGMGEVQPAPWRIGTVPGDGGTALVPMFLSPARAKEYLMLAREYTAKDLERLGVINWAVPTEEVDQKVDSIVSALLRRSAYALAWTKRIANKRIVDQLNLALDPSVAYQLVSILQFRAAGTDAFDL